VMCEVLAAVLFQHRRRERPEPLAELGLAVDARLHRGIAGVTEDRSAAERAGAELHAPLEPAHDLSPGEESGDRLAQRRRILQVIVRRAHAVEELLDLRIGILGPEQRALLGIPRVHDARAVEELVPDEQRDAERAARVARGRLYPHVVERSLAE